MKYIILFGILAILLLSGCSGNEIKPTMVTYTISDEPNVKTFVIEDEATLKLGASREKKNYNNKVHYQWESEREEKQRLIDKKTKSWSRVIDQDRILGYDEEEDEFFYRTKTLEELRDC